MIKQRYRLLWGRIWDRGTALYLRGRVRWRPTFMLAAVFSHQVYSRQAVSVRVHVWVMEKL